MTEVSHDSQVDPHGGDPFKQSEKLICFGVGGEFEWPKTERFGANSYGLDVGFPYLVEQRGEITLKRSK